MLKSSFSRIVATGCMLALLQGCAAMVVAGAGGAAVSSAEDRRSIGTQIDDNTLELRASSALGELDALNDNAHILVKSVNGSLLVVGQAPNEYLRDLAIKTLTALAGVKQVHNQIKIGSTTSIATQTNDVWITTKVKAKLLLEDSVRSNNIQVLTENGEVFLMGLVTAEEADKAVEVVRNISGVAKVVKVFEIL